MSSTIPEAVELPAGGDSMLTTRIRAVQAVTATASRQATKLQEHGEQVEALLARLAGQIESLPQPEDVDRLVKRIESLQAMIDWASTRRTRLPTPNPPPGGEDGGFLGIQARLSVSRMSAVDLLSQIQKARALELSLAEIREGVAAMSDDLATLAGVREKADLLLQETNDLASASESPTEGASNPVDCQAS